FVPHLYNHERYYGYGCGANALSTITGICPTAIRNTNKNEDDWRDSFMLQFLRKCNYKVIPLTKCNLTNRSYCRKTITTYHVLLVSSLLKKNEASWQIIYGGYIFHNFEICQFTNFELFDNPILTAYLIF